MRQSLKRRKRNAPVKSELKTLFKKELKYISEGKTEEAVKLLPTVYSIIDIACKKNLIHQNNAARKKSRLARELNDLQKNGPKAASVATTSKVETERAEKKAAKVVKKAEKAEKKAAKAEKAEEAEAKTE